MPSKYEFGSVSNQTAAVHVMPDGSVSVHHSGIEMGQGIDTKVVQAVASGLRCVADVSIDAVLVAQPKSTDDVCGWKTITAGSATSEECVKAALRAAETVAGRLQKYSQQGGTLADAAAAASKAGENLSATGTYSTSSDSEKYFIWSAACCEVELDVLTGEVEILSTEIVYDAGTSLNPMVDLGQVTGAWLQGVGMVLMEGCVRTDTDGRLINNGTWDYKIPSALDIPMHFNVSLLDSGPNTSKNNVAGSKATGEPATLLGSCPFFAVKAAIAAARSDAGVEGWFRLDCPAGPARVQQLCCVSPSQFFSSLPPTSLP